MTGMSTAASRTRRRNRAAALRAKGMSTRQIAARLRVSQPTIVRDLAALRDAEGEAVLAALRGEQPARPRRLTEVSKRERMFIRQDRWKPRQSIRRYDARRLRGEGASLREISRKLGVSPATVMRDLRQLPSGRNR
jgi:transposase